jgi:3-hydroxyisobutyrate dehydrogenase-like beta-hydroxyacid dehydrogenase
MSQAVRAERASEGREGAPVTVIGLGLMGSALARALVRSGAATTVWNRTPGKADDLAGEGAQVAASLAAAVAASPLLIVCVRDNDTVRELLEPVRETLAGKVLVNLTSLSSAEAREMVGWAAERGATYLDGAIMMTPPGIGTPEAVIFYGGSAEAFEEHAATLRVLGGGTEFLGTDAGIPSLYDVALLGVMWGTFNSFLHATALVGTENIPAVEFVPYITNWLGAVTSFMPTYAAQIDRREFRAVDATLETQLPPIRHLVAESRVRGIDATTPEYIQRLVEAAVAKGHALDSYGRIIDELR